MPSDLRRITHLRQLGEVRIHNISETYASRAPFKRWEEIEGKAEEVNKLRWEAQEQQRRSLPPLWRQYLCGPLHDSWVTRIERTKDQVTIHLRHWPAEDFAHAWNSNLDPCPVFPVILKFKGVTFAAGRRAMPDGKLVWSSWDLGDSAGWVRDGFFQLRPTLQFAAQIFSWNGRDMAAPYLICLIEASDLEIIELQESTMRRTLGDEPADIWRQLLDESKASPEGIPVMMGACCMDHYLVDRFGDRFTKWR